MVKEKNDMAILQSKDEEISLLRAQIEKLRQEKVENVGELGDSIANEIKTIRRKGGPSAESIVVREINDHKNVYLYHKDGSRVGPLHPNNAIQTLHRFANIGVRLTATKPTPEQIEAYSQTKEYKDNLRILGEKRDRKNKSKKSGQLDRLCSLLEKQYGLSSDQTRGGLLKQEEVKLRAK